MKNHSFVFCLFLLSVCAATGACGVADASPQDTSPAADMGPGGEGYPPELRPAISVSHLSDTGATVAASIAQDGLPATTERGVCVSIAHPLPATSDLCFQTKVLGDDFQVELTGLLPTTTYYARAYALNGPTGLDVGYSSATTFTTQKTVHCLASVTDVDANTYEVVQVGDQCWTKQNLKVKRYPDGMPIPLLLTDAVWGVIPTDGTGQGYTYYDYKSANAATYGLLYTWATAVYLHAPSSENPSGVQGVCPQGFHVPSHQEFLQLGLNVGGYARGGDQLKEAGYSHWVELSDGTGATNGSAFTALPGGRIYPGLIGTSEKRSEDLGYAAYFWTTTEDTGKAVYQELDANSRALNNLANFAEKSSGFSVRCLQD